MKSFLRFSFFVLLIALSLSTVFAVPIHFRINGTITSSETGNPLQGVNVSLYNPYWVFTSGNYYSITTPNGYYLIDAHYDGDPCDRWNLSAKDSRYVTNSTNVSTGCGPEYIGIRNFALASRISNNDIHLINSSGMQSNVYHRGDNVLIWVLLKDQNGNPQTGASVYFTAPNGSQILMTGSAGGNYSYNYHILWNDPLGNWNIGFIESGVTLNSVNATVLAVNLTIIINQPASGTVYNLGETVPLDVFVRYPDNTNVTTGTVNATISGQVIPLTNVVGGRWNGSYTLPAGTTPGQIAVNFNANDSWSNMGANSTTINTSNQYLVTIISPINGANYSIGQNVTINVTVRDSHGNYVDNAIVTANDPSGATLTFTQDGNYYSYVYTITSNATWTITVNATKDGNFGSATTTINLQTPAGLDVTMWTNLPHPGFCNKNQTYTVWVNVANLGQAAANNVSVNLTSSFGSSVSSGFLIPVLAGGTNNTSAFTVTCPDTTGTDTITATANGTEANTGEPVSDSAQITVQIQIQAGGDDDGELEIGAGNVTIVPDLIGRNMQATVTAIVTNDGQARANDTILTWWVVIGTDCSNNSTIVNYFTTTGIIPPSANIPGENSTTYTFNISTTNATSGNYSICVRANGTDENENLPVISDVGSAPFEVDADGPYWSNLIFNPTNTTQYMPGISYNFSIDWADVHNVTWVDFVFNGISYNASNMSCTPSISTPSTTCIVTLLNLDANNYAYIWSAGDALGNINSTGGNYVVNSRITDTGDPNTSWVRLFINDEEHDWTLTYGNITNATAWTNISATEGSFILYFNNTPLPGLIDPNKILPVGYHMYSAVFTNYTPNYQPANITRYINITQAPSTCSLTLLPESPITYGNSTTAFCSCTNYDNPAHLYRNDTDVTGEIGNPVSLAAGQWNYVCNVSGVNSNYSGASNSTIYIVNPIDSFDPANPLVTLLVNGTTNNRTLTYGNVTNATAWTNITEGTFTLYLDGISLAPNLIDIQMLPTGNHTYTAVLSGATNYINGNLTIEVDITPRDPYDPNDPTNSLIHLAINGSEIGPFVYAFPNETNATGWTNITEGNITLILTYPNGTVVNFGTVGAATPIEDIRTLPEGISNYTLIFSGSTNYLGDSVERLVNILDRTPPTVIITSPAGGSSTEGPSVFLNVTTNENTSCIYWTDFNTTVDGIDQTNGFIHNETIPYQFPDGIYTVYVNCTDLAGNTGSANRTFTVDTIGPVVTIYEPVENSLHNGTVTLIFSTDENATCQYQNETGVGYTPLFNVTGGTNYTFIITYNASGNKTLRVDCYDPALNLGWNFTNFEVDVTPPEITLLNDYIVPGDIIDFTITDAHNVSSAWYNGNCTGILQNTSATAWYINTSDNLTCWNSANNITIRVFANDTLNNIGNQTYQNGILVDEIIITIDNIAPNVTIITPNASWYNVYNPIGINATAQDDLYLSSVVYYFNSSSQIALTCTGSDIDKNCTGINNTLGLADGNYTLFVRATDRAGLSGEANVTDIAIDNTGPAVTIASPTESQIITLGSTFQLTATAADAGVGINNPNASCYVYLNSVFTTSFAVLPYVNGTCSGALVMPATTPRGEGNFTVRISDDLGNVGTSAPRRITLVVETQGPSGGPVNMNTTNNTTNGTGQLAAIKMTIDPTSISMLNNETFALTVTLENIGVQALGSILISTYDLPVTDYLTSPHTISLEPGQTGTMTLQISPKSLNTGIYSITFTGGNIWAKDTKTITLTVTNITTLLPPVTPPPTTPPTGGITGFFITAGKFAWSNLIWILLAIAIALGLYLTRGRFVPWFAARRKKQEKTENQQDN